MANAKSNNDYFPLDLSVSNPELAKIDFSNSNSLENYIEEQRQHFNSEIAFGGYIEKRNLYQRSIYFKNDDSDERNIHIGMDLWTAAGIKIICPLDGWIHSFKNNANIGDYGPTLILKHQLENLVFYTLYGHLSLKSIENLEEGTVVKKGQIIGTLGKPTENGDYAPHLHFQIIKDIANYDGDYPGVCSQNNLDFYLENCPNPNLLLKIKN